MMISVWITHQGFFFASAQTMLFKKDRKYLQKSVSEASFGASVFCILLEVCLSLLGDYTAGAEGTPAIWPQRWWIDVQCYRFKHQPLLQSCHYQLPLILFLLAPHVYIPSTLHLPCLYQQWTLLQVGDHVLMALMMSRTAGTCTSCLLYALWFVHSMGATLWGSWYKHLCKWASFHLLLWVMIQ